MTMRVEFLPGTSLEEAITDARDKARALNLAYILFNFNGVSFSIGQYADLDVTMEQWELLKGTSESHICVP